MKVEDVRPVLKEPLFNLNLNKIKIYFILINRAKITFPKEQFELRFDQGKLNDVWLVNSVKETLHRQHKRQSLP